jgi:hypothetical protein
LSLSAMNTSPSPSTATPHGYKSWALVAAPPSPRSPPTPVPATVVITPLAASTRRTRWLSVSVTKMLPAASTATPLGYASPISVPGTAPRSSASAPHAVAAHASQPSAGLRLASSHASPASTTASPHASTLPQSARQPSPLAWLPSSHASPGSTVSLPQPPTTHRPPTHTPWARPMSQASPSAFGGAHASTWAGSAHASPLGAHTRLAGHTTSPHWRSCGVRQALTAAIVTAATAARLMPAWSRAAT